MIRDILFRTTIGIALGGINTFIALSIMKYNNFEATVSEIWSNMLAGLLIGIYFGLSSFIFQAENWSSLKKTIIHFISSIIAYYVIAFPVGWVPFTTLSIILSALLFALIYSVYWTGFYLYYRRMAATMNKDLQKK